MRVTFSDQERAGVFALLERGNDWGGSEQALLLRDETYEALALSEFERDRGELDVAKLGAKQKPVELRPEVVDYVLAVVVQPGQPRALGRLMASVVRRLRAQRPAPKPKQE